jgi:parvulin-like peptidyl-prolyl isomerase
MRGMAVLIFAALSAAHGADTTAVVARAGAVNITEREFVDRFTLMPWGASRNPESIDSTKVQFARSLVAEKLLAQEAGRRGFEQDTVIRSTINELRSMLARDQLYLREVRDAVTVTDVDVDAHLKDAAYDRQVTFVIFARHNDAVDYRSRMKTAADLDRLNIPRGARAERDSVRMVWGQAQPALEAAAWSLKPGGLSDAIRTPMASYIVGVKGVERNETFLKKDLPSRRKYVADVIRRRREQERAALRGAQMLSSRIGRSLPDSFMRLINAIRILAAGDTSGRDIFLETAAQQKLADSLGVHVADTLTTAGGHAWSILDGIRFLGERRFSVNAYRLSMLPHEVNAGLREMVERELLSDEGLSRRLDTTAAVRYRLGVWKDALLASRMRADLGRNIEATSSDLWAYARLRDSLTAVPEVRVRELRTKTRADMREALGALEKGMTFEEVIRRWSTDQAGRERGGLTEFFPVTERLPVGPVAAEMTPGERMGPLTTADGFVTFEVVEKRIGKASGERSDSSLSGEIRREAVAHKQQQAINREIARLRDKYGASVDAARLKALQVFSFPVVTYQTIGIGGRMLAVPPMPMEFQWWDGGSSLSP